jgi:cation transport ATPase
MTGRPPLARRIARYAKFFASVLGLVATALTALPADASWQKQLAAVLVAAAGSVLVLGVPNAKARPAEQLRQLPPRRPPR